MANEFGGIMAADTAELLDGLVAKAEDLNALDAQFNWSKYNEYVEKAAQEVPEQVSISEGQKALATISSVVEGLLTVDGLPFSFNGRAYLKGLYDLVEEYPNGCRNQLWHTGRQIEKSTTQSAKSIALGIARPAYKTLYVAPRFDQVTVFSQQRFKPMCEDSSQILGRWVRPSTCLWQVGAKQFANGSFYNFRSCYLTADNARGITAQHLMVDEIQDILSDNIPILEQCQSHASREERFNSYAGTPKTSSNVITRRWNNSCQFEWLTKCAHCNHWNYQDDNIVGHSFFECVRCRKSINPKDGVWVPGRPDLLDKCWGFRIPQTMVPFKEHADILAIKNDPQISRRQYFNECLGLAYDEGELVLIERNIIDACNAGDGAPIWDAKKSMNMTRRTQLPLFAGIDYGTGEGDNPSFTVIAIGFMNTLGKFQVIYIEKFTGEKSNLARQPGMLNELCREYGIKWIGGDWGFGAPLNQRLVDEYGWPRYDANQILMEFQYVKAKKKADWNPHAQRYVIDRNKAMSDLIDSIRKKNVVFFRFEDMRPFVNDFTTIFIEYDDLHGTIKYDHQLPDDTFHAVNYAYLCCQQYYGKLVQTALPNTGEEVGQYTVT